MFRYIVYYIYIYIHILIHIQINMHTYIQAYMRERERERERKREREEERERERERERESAEREREREQKQAGAPLAVSSPAQMRGPSDVLSTTVPAAMRQHAPSPRSIRRPGITPRYLTAAAEIGVVHGAVQGAEARAGAGGAEAGDAFAAQRMRASPAARVLVRTALTPTKTPV